MLRIYTDNKFSNKDYLINIEAEFNIDRFKMDTLYTDEVSQYVLKEIEGVTSRKGCYLDAKFGTIIMTDISTGCKALLLCIRRHDDCIVCMDEVGTNAIKLLEYISEHIEADIEVVTHRVLKYFRDDFECYVNDELCRGEDISDALEYLLEEEEDI